MVLNQMNQMNSNCGCGNGKCCNCAFSLICSKSPYCCIKDIECNCNCDCNGGSSCNLQPVLDAISQGFSYLNGRIDTINQEISEGNSYINNHIDSLSTNFGDIQTAIVELRDLQSQDFSYLNNHIDSSTNLLYDKIDTSFAEINNKLDEILNKLPILNPSVATNLNSVESNGIVPYSAIPSDNDSILVEKKGMFGKTKWVEEKKK